ncbi:MAG: nucleotidyltransferase family protein [Anaerolineae bacterium]
MQFNRVENQLLVLCARMPMADDDVQALRSLLQRPIDWDYLIDIALNHQVLPLLHENIKRAPDGIVSHEHLAQLEDVYQPIFLSSISQTMELKTMLRLFQEHRIPVIPLKGPVLAQSLYNNVALRMYTDLDLFVPRDRVDEATALFLNNGYRFSAKQDHRKNVKTEQLLHHYQVVKDDRFYVELHWSLAPQFSSTPGEDALFWNSAREESCLGMTVLLPSPEEQLIYLCQHGTRHVWTRLMWVCDVTQQLRVHPAMDWAYILDRVTRSHIKRQFLLGLHLSSRIFGTTLPAEIEREIASDGKIPPMSEQIIGHIFEEKGQTREERFVSTHLMRLRTREGRGQQFRYLYEMMRLKSRPTAKDMESVPPFLRFMSYLRRPFRLVRVYGRVLFQRFRRSE